MIKLRWIFNEWTAFTLLEIQEREIFLVLAVAMWNKTTLRLRLYKWRLTVLAIIEERNEAIAKAVFLCNATLLRKVIEEWHYAAHTLREEDIAIENQNWMSAMMSKADEDRELRDMTDEDEEMHAFNALELKLRLEKEEKEYWEHQNYTAKNELKRKSQEKDRLAMKEAKHQEKLQSDHDTWGILAKKGADRVTLEANKWLDTPMGKQYIKENAREFLTTDDDELNMRLRGPGKSIKATHVVCNCC